MSSKIIRYIISVAAQFPVAIIIMLVSALLWAVDMSLGPYLLKIIFNTLAGAEQHLVFELLFWPITYYIGRFFVKCTLWRFYDYCVDYSAVPRIRQKIYIDAFNKILDKNHKFFQDNFSGSIASKINDLQDSIPNIIKIVIDKFICHILALIIAVFTLKQINALFAYAMLSWSILFIGAAIALSKRFSIMSDQWSEINSQITGHMVDAFSNMLSVRLFAAKGYESNRFFNWVQRSCAAEQKLQWWYFWVWFFYGYSFFVLQVCNFYFLCKGRSEGWVTVGDFALVIMINTSIIDFLWQFMQDISQSSRLYGKITQALRTIDASEAVLEAKNSPDLIITKGAISFSHVYFHYKHGASIFTDLSLEIPGGQKVGLVGYSGGGKTTFVNLILRLYDVMSGTIKIDGQDITQINQKSLYQNIAMIPQDPSLFHRSLYENIAYGFDGSNEAEVLAAAKEAHAHDFISQLSDRYDSLVGERGVKISGGQRQRIALARAILKNAPILIMDEATSQLDSLTEGEIQDSLWKLMQGKTTIVIAHRLATLLHMDRILVFDNGKIVEDGKHEFLLKQNGLYKNMWDAQIGGFLPHLPQYSNSKSQNFQ